MSTTLTTETLADRIRLRAVEDAARPYVTFLEDDHRNERRLTYAELETRALAVQGHLARRGLVQGDRVMIVLPTGLDFVETFFGIVLGGMVPVPVYPPARLARLEHYLRTLGGIAEAAACRASVIDERLVPLVGKQVTSDGRPAITDRELREPGDPGRAQPIDPASPAFLQFTSGTTSQPKGVVILHRQLHAQLVSYCEALHLQRGENVVSWLPLYHDLGLVGMLLATLHQGAHLVLFSPVDFLREPMTWIRALSRWKAIHTAAPNFAFDLAVRKCPEARLREEKIDLSSVANAGMGGEPISVATVERFRAHFAPFGFKGDVLNPCLGMAENTLVVTGHRRGEPLRRLTLSRAGLQANEVRAPAGENDTAALAGNGKPFPGVLVRIAGPAGEPLAERKIGEIWVGGTSVAAGYFNDKAATDAAFVVRDGERWLRSGDLGFTNDGDLYVCGRKKDLMIVRGRNLHPQDLEEETGRVKGVRTGNVVAFAVDRGGGEGEAAVLVAEVDARAGRAEADVRRDVVEAIAAAFQLAVEVVLVPQGSIPKTSSGKLQRSLVKEAHKRGDLASLAPPGRLATGVVKLRLAWDALARRLRPAARAESKAREHGATLDPRFQEALGRVKKEGGPPLVPSLRVDGLGLDSLERVELWLQLGRLFEAKVPDEELDASQTLGDLQAVLERHQGTAPADASQGDQSSLLVGELLAEDGPAPPASRPPRSAGLAFRAFGAVTRTVWGFEVQGLEHLALEPGYLLAGNHQSYLDPAWVRLAVPPAVHERLVAFHWAHAPAFTRPFLAQMSTIPIDPEGSFRPAIRAGLEALRRQKIVLIFPEGARTHQGGLLPFRPGVGLLSLLSQRPIVPFRTRGMFEVFPRDRAIPRFVRGRGAPPIDLRFGPPLTPPVLDPAQAWTQAHELVRRLRSAVEAL